MLCVILRLYVLLCDSRDLSHFYHFIVFLIFDTFLRVPVFLDMNMAIHHIMAASAAAIHLHFTDEHPISKGMLRGSLFALIMSTFSIHPSLSICPSIQSHVVLYVVFCCQKLKLLPLYGIGVLMFYYSQKWIHVHVHVFPFVDLPIFLNINDGLYHAQDPCFCYHGVSQDALVRLHSCTHFVRVYAVVVIRV